MDSENIKYNDGQGEEISSRNKNKLSKILKSLLKSKTGAVGIVIVILTVFLAVFAPFIASHDPNMVNPDTMMIPPSWEEGGSPEYLLGTDNLGRDILSRIIFGSRISLMVGICSVVVAGIIGIILGLTAGYYGGIADSIIMRLTDAFLSIPRVLLAMVVLAVVGSGVPTLIFVLGVTNWVSYSRLIRGEVLSVKQKEFVKASVSIGTSNIVIIIRHILPNVFSSFIVVSTLAVAQSIISEASLSFLGLGIQPPIISWGGMLSDGRSYLATNWWVATFPGLAITIIVLGIMFLGNWLRDYMDPHNQGLK